MKKQFSKSIYLVDGALTGKMPRANCTAYQIVMSSDSGYPDGTRLSASVTETSHEWNAAGECSIFSFGMCSAWRSANRTAVKRCTAGVWSEFQRQSLDDLMAAIRERIATK